MDIIYISCLFCMRFSLNSSLWVLHSKAVHRYHVAKAVEKLTQQFGLLKVDETTAFLRITPPGE